jgi:TonB family protein
MPRPTLSSPNVARSAGRAAALLALAFASPAAAQAGEGAVPRGGAGAVVTQPEPAEPAGKSVIVEPKLVHFENADYPSEAQARGLQAQVVLKLTIDRQGKVTRTEVVEPAGHGFDEAARAAALKFVFEPATRDGKPVPAVILYRYDFTLTPKAEAEPAPAAPVSGKLSGFLRMAGSDVPLAGVEVTLIADDGSEQRSRTDERGVFEFGALPPGKYRLRADAPGFYSGEYVEQVGAGELTEVTYRLAPVGDGTEIVVRGERPPREVTRRTIERREIERIPGTSGDALRSIQSLPGVARPPGLAGLLIVRGSEPEGTNVFVDGTLVPLAYHFGGLSSVVPTELLERIDFYPGNFGVRYGRVQGGIVDVGLKSPDTTCSADYGKPSDLQGCYHGMLQADLIDARFLVQGPLGPLSGWSFAVAGRRSWLDSWLKPVLEEAGSSVTSAPVYYDYQLIVERKDRDSRLSFRAFGADDRIALIITDPAAEDPAFGGNLSFGTSFYRLQAFHETKLARDVELKSMVSVGRDKAEFSLGNFLFQIELLPVYMREEFTFRASRAVKINAGLDFLVSPFDIVVRLPDPPRPGEPAPGPFATRPPREVSQESTLFRPAWYAEVELQPVKRLRVVPGVRLDYARDSSHADVSPRIHGRYDLIAGGSGEGDGFSPRTTLKGGVGMFHQPPEGQETNEVFGTPGLYSNRALHYALGVEQELSRRIEASVEGFYKDLTRQVARSPSAAGGYVYNNDGLGSVIGLETLIKYKPDERFFGWLAYTLSRSVLQESPTSEERLFEFDQTHNLIVLGSYRLGRGWEFGGRFRLVSGPLATPALAYPSLPALYAADAGTYTPLQGEPFSRRLPLFHQLDLRVDKRWQFRDWRFSAYLDVQNVYNNAAAEALVYNYNFSKEQYQTGIPIIPSIGVRGEF